MLWLVSAHYGLHGIRPRCAALGHKRWAKRRVDLVGLWLLRQSSHSNPLIERQRCRDVPSSAPVLVRGGELAPRSWLVVACVARCRVVSGEFNGRLIMSCSAR